MKMQPKIIREMRAWVEESFPEFGGDCSGFSDREIYFLVKKEYEGGIEAFIQEGLPVA